MLIRRYASRGVVLLLALLTWSLTGCVGKQWGTQGAPFFPMSRDLHASLDEFQRLEQRVSAKIGVWDLARVEDFILSYGKVVPTSTNGVREKVADAPLPERHVTVTRDQRIVSRIWRFTTVDRKTTSIPLFGTYQGRRVAFVLQVDEEAGRVARVQTSFSYLPDKEADLSSKPLITGALAIGATLLLLAP
jgi:hypothetical protein